MIHQYINHGYHIVMDVNSGSVHVVDELTYGLIPLIEPLAESGLRDAGEAEAILRSEGKLPDAPKEEVTEAIVEIMELAGAGQLFAPDIYEDYVFDFKNRKTVVKALCLHIAHDCNLAILFCRRGRISRQTGADEL